jgi:hypothetical protein
MEPAADNKAPKSQWTFAHIGRRASRTGPNPMMSFGANCWHKAGQPEEANDGSNPPGNSSYFFCNARNFDNLSA